MPKRKKFPRTWDPDKGDKLVGEIVEVREVDFGEYESTALTVRTKKGKVGIWLNACLRNQGVDDLEEGDDLKLKYLGSEKGMIGRRKIQIKHFGLNGASSCECDDDDDDDDDEDEEDDD
jgi:hypothetical protein